MRRTLGDWELCFKLRKYVANFRTYFRTYIAAKYAISLGSKYVSSNESISKYKIWNETTLLGKEKQYREAIVHKWLNVSQLFEIAQQLNLNRKTVANIVDRYLQTRNVEPGVGGNRSRTARTDDAILYTEFCKSKKPAMSAEEIQKQLVENDVVLQANVPSQASISRVLTQDLGYSYKKIRNIPQENLTDNAQRKVEK